MKRCMVILLGIIFPVSAHVQVQIEHSKDRSTMVLVPAGKYTMQVEYRWREGLAPDTIVIDEDGRRYRSIEEVKVPAFYIDKTEVTNAQFKIFMDDSGYQPKWLQNFLKHWERGMYPKGMGNHPVTWISLEDAKAYAVWAGKRLPTESEWQKAAQGTDSRAWPWGNLYDPNLANMDSDRTRSVGSYTEGASPYGCLDMAGNVWEWTDSYHDDGNHFYVWIRGGSYFFAKGSHWYMQGGPVPVYQRAKFLLMSPALNRCATIGFRCAKDAK